MFYFSHGCFFSHGILSPSALISPHKFNKYHEYLSLRDVFLPQISLIVTNYNFFSHRLHRLKRFFLFFFLIRLFRLCLKLCSTDYTDFLSLRDVLFLSRMFFASHGTLSLISPHKFNKYHEYLSLRDVFLPQITQIIKIFFFFLIFRFAQDFVLLMYKTLLITKFALRITQIFYRCAMFFSQLFSFSHKLHEFYKSFRYYFFVIICEICGQN